MEDFPYNMLEILRGRWGMDEEDMSSQDNKRLSPRAQFAGLFFGAAFGVAAVYILAALYFGAPISDALKSAHGIIANQNAVPITSEQSWLLIDMIMQGSIIPANGHILDVTNYYTSVIDVLLMIIALLSVIAFFVVRATSKSAAEDMAEVANAKAIKHYFGSQSFHDDVLKAVKARSADVIGDLQGYQEEIEERMVLLDGAVKRAEDLKLLMVTFEDALARLDDYEAVGGNLELQDGEIHSAGNDEDGKE